ncbi:uncharacterized protein LOC117296766 isoform X2 [Asterias rubens]|uniref:uncharacterized protein LOC117296766 isoform X2 n=1 Tax=Asterias rubens TaxID=7604 RepID=UPI0014559174|nr:uncharacterized protein LOC117296766 isoform X2 [Asterias rubens]
MGSLMYISCVLLMTNVPLIDSSYRLMATSSVVEVCLGKELRLSCHVRFGTSTGTQSLAEVGWNRGEGAYGRINVTACKTELEECTEQTTDSRGQLQYGIGDSNVASLSLVVKNSTFEDNATFSCFALDRNGDRQTSQNTSAIVHGLPNKAFLYPICSIKTCSSEDADNACTLSCTAEITGPMVSLDWIVSGTNSTEVRLSNNTVVIGNQVVLLYNVTERYDNAIFTCRLFSDEFPCLKSSCSIELTSASSPFAPPAYGGQSPTGFSLVMVIIMAVAATVIVIVLLLIIACFARTKGSKIKQTKMEGTAATNTTTASSERRHQNVFEDVGIYTLPDYEQTVRASHHTSVDVELLAGGNAGPPGAPSLPYEVIQQAVTDNDNQLSMKTPTQTAQVYEVLQPDEMDRATDNQGPASVGSEVVVNTPRKTAQVYEVLKPDEMDRAADNVGPTSVGSEVVVNTPRKTAQVYEVLKPDEMDRAADNQGPASVGSEVVVSTPRKTAQVYEVLKPDEMDRAADNVGPTSDGSQVVLNTPSQTAHVYELLRLKETDKTSLNDEATCGGDEVGVKTQIQTAQVYEVLKSDETDSATDNVGPTCCGGSQVVVKTLSQKALVYDVLEPDVTDSRATIDNEGPTHGGGEDVVKTPSQEAPVYDVLEPDEAKIPSSDEGATYEECDVNPTYEMVSFPQGPR